VGNYPEVCPAGAGLADETGDRLGTAPEMYSPAPHAKSIDTKGDSTLMTISQEQLVGATKRAAEEAIDPIRKKNKKLARSNKSLQKQLKKALATPDYSKSAHRATAFAPTHGAPVIDINDGKKERVARAKSLVSNINDRHSGSSFEDIRELEDLGFTPDQVAAMLVADES
jgi:hypothetical protein